MKRILEGVARRKASREEKRKDLPWGKREKVAPRKPRRKRTERQIQRDRNDELWSLAVRRRDAQLYGPRCRICGQKESPGHVVLVGYHIVPKKRGDAIRWLLENGVAGCTRCNMGERMNPLLYRDKHVALLGKDAIERLEARARIHADFSMDDLKAIGSWLKAVLETEPGQQIPAPPPCLS